MSVKNLVPMCWTLWSVLAVCVAIASVLILTEKSNSHSLGHGLGPILVIGLVLMLTVSGGVLYWIARSQSLWGFIVATLVVLSPLVLIVSRPAVAFMAQWRNQRELARVGSFTDAHADAMARAIETNDLPALAKLLDGHKPPTGVDRAGLDLLGWSAFVVGQRQGSAEPMRALLEAGADPKECRLPEGASLLSWLVLRCYDNREALTGIELLLKHGADPDQKAAGSLETPLRQSGSQPAVVRLLVDHGADLDRLDEYGQPPVVHFIGTQQWDSAILLIERGARLDLVAPSGISIDHYLREWRSDVYGDQPEGWERVKTAIAARRKAESTHP
jgi:hypothetical protein